MKMRCEFRFLALVLPVLALSGCGGGGGGGGSAPATAPVLSLSGIGIKQLQFSWPSVDGATHYRLWENDGASGYVQVGGDIVGTSATRDVAVHRHNWDQALYQVEACNSDGCGPRSNEVNTLGRMLDAVGYFKASNTGANYWFGYATALSADGNTLVIGAEGENSKEGAVYVFDRNGGEWTQTARLKAPNAGSGDVFGARIALSDDGKVLAVGVPNEDGGTTTISTPDDNSATNAGAVYVFTRNDDGSWNTPHYLKATTIATDANFGAVALSGDGQTLAVGALNEGLSAGAVYVFTNNNGAWLEQGHITASGTSWLGIVTALSDDGNTLAAGSMDETVYVLTRDSGNVWSAPVLVKASNPQADDMFGADSIALSGDGSTLAVGAKGEDGASTVIDGPQDEGASSSGAVYVFTRNGNTWPQQSYVKASDTAAGAVFGTGVALSDDGNTMMVGASNAFMKGAVYVFSRNSGAWSEQKSMQAPNAGDYDSFGVSVALSDDGSTLAVGAEDEQSNATGVCATAEPLCAQAQTNDDLNSAGAVYLY